MIDLVAAATIAETLKPNEQVLVTQRWLKQAIREMQIGQSLMRNPIVAHLDHLVDEQSRGTG